MTNQERPKFTHEIIASAEKQIDEQSKRIEFYITEYSIELLALKMSRGDFVIPDYQRNFTWEAPRKSRFIDSLLMGLPVPFLFFWEYPETGKLEIVDGSQRLRTLEEFVHGNFALSDLEELSLAEGFRFRDFPDSRQQKFKNRSIRGIVLSEHADEQSRFELFDRINTGSKIANFAEVRRGTRRGPFLQLVISLTQDSTFDDLAPVSDKQEKEREKDELITRFFAYGDGLEDYKDRVSAFLFAYAKKMNKRFEQNPADVEAYRQRFLDTMAFVSHNFPWGFRRSPNGTTTPRARFEAIAIGSYLALQERPELAAEAINVDNWLHSDEFAQITGSDGANAKSRLQNRMYFVRDHLLGA